MRPFFKISNLRNLQDARYSAAAGFDFISFNLERGNEAKLSTETVWNIANWLSGPKYILELNAASVEELSSLSMAYHALSFPAMEWPLAQAPSAERYLLQVEIEEVASAMDRVGEETGIQWEVLNIQSSEQITDFQARISSMWLNFSTLDTSLEFLKSGSPLPLGISLRAESEEFAGQLDYEALDAYMDIVREKFPM